MTWESHSQEQISIAAHDYGVKGKTEKTRVIRGRENALSQSLSTRRYSAEVIHAILLGKARTTFNKWVPIPEIDTDALLLIILDNACILCLIAAASTELVDAYSSDTVIASSPGKEVHDS
ncbi:ORF61c protein [Spatholobus suberectus]|nr:ORF61c protein [Spatholobus suberectus]